MNGRQLAKLGVPTECNSIAIQAVQSIAKHNRTVDKALRINIRDAVKQTVKIPTTMIDDTHFGNLALAIIDEALFVRPDPISYRTWGIDGIDQGSHEQMKQACSMPMAVGAALMPDAHLGYGLPIGGVLALDNAVCPFAVGVDIACRMKLTIYPMTALDMQKYDYELKLALSHGTVFGVGQEQTQKQNHAVMDQDWDISKVTSRLKDRAHWQLGTSGSGNHFVEWGVLFVEELSDLDIPAGEYVALLSHSGSRGVGANVCNNYSKIARDRLPKRYEDLGRLAWLDMDSEEGKTYAEIAQLLYCAKSLVCYHLNEDYKQSVKKAAVVWRKQRHPFCKKADHFINNRKSRDYSKKNISYLTKPSRRFYDKIKFFQYNLKTKEYNMKFTIKDVIDKIGKSPICYLTGDLIDIQKTNAYAFDHMIPRSKHGDSSIDNLGLCTKEANQAKSDLTPDEFIALCKKVLIHQGYIVKKI